MTEQKFKYGDIVTCVDAGENIHIKVGKDYTVVSQESWPGGWVTVLTGKGTKNSYRPHRFKLKETEKMTNKTSFVETVTTKKIKSGLDQRLSNGALISVSSDQSMDRVYLVVGAECSHGHSFSFGKRGLAELIEVLKEVHEVMND